ncbi:MAG: acyltransferase family protein [Ktedonobacterales bacterium]
MGVAEVGVKPIALVQSARWRRLIPQSTSPGDIRSLDGLRAVAALSVLTFHAIQLTHDHLLLAGADFSFLAFYLQTGVHLFFILSGFLLFMPYARAMLDARPLPSARRFYQRRALRILPAYWVCLAILVLVALPSYLSIFGLKDILFHLALVHDDSYYFSRGIEGPFWTLAVEAQFYLILPLVALGISRIVGASRSVARLVTGLLAFIALALVARYGDAIVQGRHLTMAPSALATAMSVFLRVTLGAQGKFLDVFGVGMLCGVLYVAAERGQWMRRTATRMLGVACFIAGLGAIVGLAALEYHKEIAVPAYFLVVNRRDILTLVGPLLVGCGYALVVLGVLWSGRAIRGVFEGRVIVFVGLISYSLYLWQEPLLRLCTPALTSVSAHWRIGISLLAGLLMTVPVAYLSYQFVERPFLRRRQRLARAVQQSEKIPTP